MASKSTTKKTKAPAKKTTTKSAAKPTKKPTVKTSAKTSTPVKNNVVEAKIKAPQKTQVLSTTEKVTTPNTAVKVKKSYVILAVIIVLLGALAYFGRSLFVAAVVNGQPISRYEIVNEAEKQSGKQALNAQVRNLLVEQEAKKQNITVSQKEIDDEVKKVEANLAQQGQKLDQVLQLQGMTRGDLEKLLKLNILIKKLVGKDIKVSDKEVADYIDQNKEMLPQDQSEDALKKSVAEQLKQQKLNEKVKTWLDGLEKKANVIYFVQY